MVGDLVEFSCKGGCVGDREERVKNKANALTKVVLISMCVCVYRMEETVLFHFFRRQFLI